MKRNLMPLLTVAFIAAVAATGIFYGLLLPRIRPGGGGGGVVGTRVVVAVRAMDRGAQLRADDLSTVTMDGSSVPKHAFHSPEQVVGLTLLRPVSAREPLDQAAVSARGEKGGASLAVPPGYRAVSIHPERSGGVVALLRSGSRIDILVLDRSQQSTQMRRLLEDVEVLGVGPEKDHSRPEVTVLALPNDAERLSLADAAMQLRVHLRNPGDRSGGSRGTITPTSLFRAPAARPAVSAGKGGTATTAQALASAAPSN